jgi:putative membrane protein
VVVAGHQAVAASPAAVARPAAAALREAGDMAMMHKDDHHLVASAIRAAEAQTDGEIYAVLARRSDNYFAPAAFAISVATMLGALLCALFMHYYWVQADNLVFVTAVTAAWATALAILWFVPDLCRYLVPRKTLYKRAHQNAANQFLARNIHLTKNRTGVLLFVSVEERYAEVCADEAIDLRVAQEEWDGIVAMLIEHASRADYAAGYLKAIAASGALLAQHFPKSHDDRNELDDHLIEI